MSPLYTAQKTKENTSSLKYTVRFWGSLCLTPPYTERNACDVKSKLTTSLLTLHTTAGPQVITLNQKLNMSNPELLLFQRKNLSQSALHVTALVHQVQNPSIVSNAV